jgi:WD repeat-containing protein 35
VLAVGGVSLTRGSEDKQGSQVQFYSPFGAHLRTLRIPGSRLSGLTWEGGGLRMALAIDSFIYFANVRPDYKWGYFANTLVYAYTHYERPESVVVFYNATTGEKVTKYVKNLLHVCAQGEFCALVTRVDEDAAAGAAQQYLIILCNAIGSPVEIKCAVHLFLPFLSLTFLCQGTCKLNPS